jgi:hypothetical protein
VGNKAGNDKQAPEGRHFGLTRANLVHYRKFSLVLFDNGNDRFFPPPSGQVLCTTVATSTCYSTVPVLQLDETLKIATLAFHPHAPFYSYFGGNAEVLKNGNVEYCETAGAHGGDI